MVNDMEFIATRIMTATPIELVDISYTVLLDSLEEALNALKDINTLKAAKDMDNRDKQPKLDLLYEKYYKTINKAHDLLAELLKSLDMSQEISKDLMALYFYVQKLIIKAKTQKNLKSIEESIKVLTPLYTSWHKLAEDQEKSSTKNFGAKSALVAGMTYGKSDIDMIGNFGSEFKA